MSSIRPVLLISVPTPSPSTEPRRSQGHLPLSSVRLHPSADLSIPSCRPISTDRPCHQPARRTLSLAFPVRPATPITRRIISTWTLLLRRIRPLLLLPIRRQLVLLLSV